jgi:hypothetical protein
VDFELANPGPAAVTAMLSVGLSAGTVVPRRVVIPSQGIVDFVSSGTGGLPQQIPFSVTVTSSAPIVVGREVLAPNGAAQPVWGSSSGTTTTAPRWLVPGPGTPSVAGTTDATTTSLAVADPGPSPSRVEVTRLGGSRIVAEATVAPGQVMVFGAKLVGGRSALSVVSSQPVFVEADAGPTGTPGVVSSTGFPFVATG